MITDARTLEEGATIEADICVVGAGPAGLTLALELARSELRVCLLESGGMEQEAAVEALSRGEMVGAPYPPLDSLRRRGFGGTASAWISELAAGRFGARLGPLDEIDFLERDGIPESGWPFERAHLEPFYRRAQEICGIGPFDYEQSGWAEASSSALQLAPERVITTMFQFGPQTAFTRDARPSLAASSTSTVLLHAHVLEILAAAGGRAIAGLGCAVLPGHRRFTVRASRFVLAAGGIENARLLLLSGLGNEHDRVGRFFMDHPTAVSRLAPADPGLFRRTALYDARSRRGTVTLGKLSLSPRLLRKEGLLNVCWILVPNPLSQTPGVESLHRLFTRARGETVAGGARADIAGVGTGLHDLLRYAPRRLRDRERAFGIYRTPWRGAALLDTLTTGPISGWSALSGLERRFSFFNLFLNIEQAPDPDRRITLGDERDAFGLRVSRLHWRWNDLEVRSLGRAHGLLQEELLRAGIGRLGPIGGSRDPALDPVRDLYSTQHHHMGTTRMHQDPRRGVVDADGLVHGLSNLYVTGSSVFPTGGYVNPTLTVVALAVRLAAHLESRPSTPLTSRRSPAS